MKKEHPELEKTVRIAGQVRHSAVDGPGVRYALFLQGCPHGCKACQNPETHDLEGGTEKDLSEVINEILSTRFLDGITLSGGESQKLALARALCNEHGILIFDEPSSAIDPVAEYNINRSIVENTKGKTVIIISHRLATTRFADRILMFDSGRVIEEGSHEELMAMNGKYAEMFSIQAEKYITRKG